MFERDPPRLTAPNDPRAFELYQQAREMEAAGQPMEAMMLFSRPPRPRRASRRRTAYDLHAYLEITLLL